MQIIRAARLIDGRRAEPLLDHALFIEDGQIHDLKPWRNELSTTQVIDLGNATLLPGFIETHAHLVLDPGMHDRSNWHPSNETLLLLDVGNAQSALRAGVTTICDAGGPNPILFALRDAIRDGTVIGPRLLASGYPITTARGHGMPDEYTDKQPASDKPATTPRKTVLGLVATTAEEVRQAVRAQVEAGADFIKTMATGGGGKPVSQYGFAELHAAVTESRNLGKRIIAHCHGTAGIRDAVEAGVTRVEHCSFLEEGDSIFHADIAAKIVEKGIYVCPTNTVDYRNWQRFQEPKDTERLAPRKQIVPTWRALYEHGVQFVAGSDAGTSHVFFDDYALIMELMVKELGMTPMQAILSGTRIAAEAIGLEKEIGTLETGKCADLVAVEGNPLNDITALRQIRLVMSSGKSFGVLFKN